jgi:hypothetical protein
MFTTHELRLNTIFGKKMGSIALFNRLAVLLGLPTWGIILTFIALPSSSDWFQQPACDALFEHNTVRRFFYGPVFLLSRRSLRTKLLIITPFGALILTWMVAVSLQYKAICRKSEVSVPRRTWRIVTDAYPFLRFYTLIVVPFMVWLAMLESGAFFANEQFAPTYGQVRLVYT